MVVETKGPGEAAGTAVNEVRLVGRVSGGPEERELPSGSVLLTFRLVVDRAGRDDRGRRRVDVLDCAVWDGRPRRSVRGWGTGDVVSVTGEVRRRFFGAGGTRASRVEIEVHGARLIRRAATS